MYTGLNRNIDGPKQYVDFSAKKLYKEISALNIQSAVFDGVNIDNKKYGSVNGHIEILLNQEPGQAEKDSINAVLDNHDPFDALEEMKKKYMAHRKAGVAYFTNIQASLKIDMDNGVTPQSAILHLEDLLDPVKSRVLTGDWLSAKAALDATPTDLIFSQQFKDSLLADINGYIDNNY